MADITIKFALEVFSQQLEFEGSSTADGVKVWLSDATREQLGGVKLPKLTDVAAGIGDKLSIPDSGGLGAKFVGALDIAPLQSVKAAIDDLDIYLQDVRFETGKQFLLEVSIKPDPSKNLEIAGIKFVSLTLSLVVDLGK